MIHGSKEVYISITSIYFFILATKLTSVKKFSISYGFFSCFVFPILEPNAQTTIRQFNLRVIKYELNRQAFNVRPAGG